MSKLIIGDQFWAEMAEDRKIDAVVTGHATLKQLSEGLLDGSDQLRNACREYLGDTSLSFENLPLDPPEPGSREISEDNSLPSELPHRTKKKMSRDAHNSAKQRFGLPDGFLPRLQRYGRTVLIERNVYGLPNGEEFIPTRPTGTLGSGRHRYALLTREQYSKAMRGSVYVRTDGKIFDYGVDTGVPMREMFDTGYTIADLERTGRYAPELPRRRKKRQQAKAKPAGAGR
jgi:hypothetical protein